MRYNIGGDNELQNIELVQQICKSLDQQSPRTDGKPYSEQIKFVTDRPGHDFRYALNTQKIRESVGWRPLADHAEALQKTVQWNFEDRKCIADALNSLPI